MEGVRGFQRELRLQDDSFLSGVVEIREYEEGDIVLKEAAHSDIALGYVVQGRVTMYCETDKGLDKLYSAEKGECFGQLAMLTGETNFYSCKATKPTVLALLSKSSFVSILGARARERTIAGDSDRIETKEDLERSARTVGLV